MFDFIKEHKIICILSAISLLVVISIYLNIQYDEVKIDMNKSEVTIEPIDQKNEEEVYYVDVKGAVNFPGVYEFSEGDIVKTIIDKAGGFVETAVTFNINLSQKLEDQMVIYVYDESEIEKENVVLIPEYNENNLINIPNTDEEENIININTASKEELTKLPGIGDTKAAAIVEYRQNNGLFNVLEDIMNVSGIGTATYDKIKNLISI